MGSRLQGRIAARPVLLLPNRCILPHHESARPHLQWGDERRQDHPTYGTSHVSLPSARTIDLHEPASLDLRYSSDGNLMTGQCRGPNGGQSPTLSWTRASGWVPIRAKLGFPGPGRCFPGTGTRKHSPASSSRTGPSFPGPVTSPAGGAQVRVRRCSRPLRFADGRCGAAKSGRGRGGRSRGGGSGDR